MRFTEDCGKLKFDKGSLCNKCVQVSDFVKTAWCGDTSDIDIREISSQNLIIDGK